MLFGVNIDVYPEVSKNVGGITSIRYYNKPGDFTSPGHVPGITGIYSVKPDTAQFLAGKLDAEINAYLRSLPRRSYVTAWHEANAPHEQRETGAPQDAGVYCQVIGKLQYMAHDVRPDLRIGSILETYPVSQNGQNLTPWIPRGIEWCGLDGYQLTSADSVYSVFSRSMSYIAHVPQQLITETNSRIEPAIWLHDVTARYRSLDGIAWYAGNANYPYRPAMMDAPLALASVACAQT